MTQLGYAYNTAFHSPLHYDLAFYSSGILPEPFHSVI